MDFMFIYFKLYINRNYILYFRTFLLTDVTKKLYTIFKIESGLP